jgi:hypothetical protein
MSAYLHITRADGVRTIRFDASLREGHEGDAQVTTHPVEKGADPADHVRIGPRKFSFDAFVSNTPIDVPETNMDGVSGRVSGVALDVPAPPFSPPIGVPGIGAIAKVAGITGPKPNVKANVLNFSGPFNRIQSVLSELWEIFDAVELIAVDTFVKRYENMVISRLSAPRTAETSGGLTFTIEISEIRVVETKTVPAPKDKSGSGAKSKGNQPAEEESESRETITHKLARKAGII